jgi:Family of unknown function (DUF6370)
MMRTASSMALGLVVLFVLALGVNADSDKEVTLKGTVTCGKCGLNVDKSCATVIKIEKDGKDVVYYFDKDSHKKYHGKVCTDSKKGTVTGTVSEKDGKNWVKVTKVEYED